MKKAIYIAGPITGIPDYQEPFEQAAEAIKAHNMIPLNPLMPEGLSNAQYMRVCLALLDSADAALFLPGSEDSPGAKVELAYAKYTGKETVILGRMEDLDAALISLQTEYCKRFY